MANFSIIEAMLAPLITLNNGVKIPQIGLGVYDPKFSTETYQAVRWALEVGYRHIDTASVYRNEAQVGKAIKDSGIPREDIFVTTKVWDSDHGFDKTLRAYQASLKELGLDYVDLYLLHWPVRATRKETYQALEQLYRESQVRAIGVSNFLAPHLEDLFTYAKVLPAINQIELTPYLNSKDTIALCQSKGIKLECYSPLVRGKKAGDPRLRSIANAHDKSTYQVLIRWGIEQGFITIPKSSNLQRIRDNFEVFDFSLSSEEMETMDSFHDGTRVAPDPMTY